LQYKPKKDDYYEAPKKSYGYKEDKKDDYYEAPKKSYGYKEEKKDDYYEAPKKSYYKEDKYDEVCDPSDKGRTGSWQG
jgi:hypothetical protein